MPKSKAKLWGDNQKHLEDFEEFHKRDKIPKKKNKSE